MATADTCVISAKTALYLTWTIWAMKLGGDQGITGFSCVECGKPVRPEDGADGPYMRHLKENPDCPLRE